MKKFLFVLLLLIPLTAWATIDQWFGSDLSDLDQIVEGDLPSGGASTETLRPDGASYNNFDISAGNYYDCLSDQSDGTYVYTAVAWENCRSTLANTATSSGKTISNVKIYCRAKCESGTCDDDIRLSLHDGVDYQYTDYFSPTGSITEILVSDLDEDPFESGAWTSANIDGYNIGAHSGSFEDTEELRVYEIWVVITYTP